LTAESLSEPVAASPPDARGRESLSPFLVDNIQFMIILMKTPPSIPVIAASDKTCDLRNG
jgi:hypothetical protein